MATFTFEYTPFIASYPEFADIAQPVVEAQADLALCEVNCYAGLPTDKQRCANWLYIAHNLQLRRRQLEPCDHEPVAKIKSKNDEEQYATTDDRANYGLASTTYGMRLQELLRRCKFGISLNAISCIPCYSGTTNNIVWY